MECKEAAFPMKTVLLLQTVPLVDTASEIEIVRYRYFLAERSLAPLSFKLCIFLEFGMCCKQVVCCAYTVPDRVF